MEARELKVNGKTPLDKWLPYDTMCDEKDTVGTVRAWPNLEWDMKNDRPRNDYPKEKVEEVVADGVHRWAVTLEPKNERDRNR